MAPPEFSGSSTNVAFGPPGILRITLIFTNFLKVATPEFEALSRRCNAYLYDIRFFSFYGFPRNSTFTLMCELHDFRVVKIEETCSYYYKSKYPLKQC